MTDARQDAHRLMELINTLSLFTRKTMVAWLPELAEELGVTVERFITMFELDLEPDSSLKYLAERLVVSPSALSVMINSMVEQGTVARIPDTRDRRRVVLRLTDQGQQELQTIEDELTARYAAYLDEVDGDDRRELISHTEALLAVVNRILARRSQ